VHSSQTVAKISSRQPDKDTTGPKSKQTKHYDSYEKGNLAACVGDTLLLFAPFGAVAPYRDLLFHTLHRDPAEQWEYSNFGMALLGQVIALKAGQSYDTLLRE
jgi:hypothetical protein